MSHPGPPQAPYGYPPQHPSMQQQAYGYPPQHAGLSHAPPYPPQRPPYASWLRRAAAYLLDVALNFGPMWVLMGTGGALEGRESTDVVANLLVWLGLLAMIATVIVQLRREGRTGQSVGKKVLGIRAIRAQDGQMLGIGLALGRRVAQALNNFVFGLGWWWALWDDKSQTFADKMCSVIVVRDVTAPPRTADGRQ